MTHCDASTVCSKPFWKSELQTNGLSASLGLVRLAAPDGRILLDPDDAIAKVGLKDGETWKMLLWILWVALVNISIQMIES